jgi:pyrroloquinoline-quinone synthase
MNADLFLGRLKHLVLGHPVLSHPLWADLELGYYDLRALKTFSVHYYHHVLRTRLYDAAALAACPDETIQSALASILWDEYGCGDNSRTHPAQFRKVLRGLSIDPREANLRPRLPELEEYSRIHFGMCRPETFWEAMGAVGFAMEWPIPYLYEPIVRGYRRIAGSSDADLEFYLEHIPTDEEHGSLVVNSLRPYLEDSAIQESLIEGAMRSMDARERLVEAIAGAMESRSLVPGVNKEAG